MTMILHVRCLQYQRPMAMAPMPTGFTLDNLPDDTIDTLYAMVRNIPMIGWGSFCLSFHGCLLMTQDMCGEAYTCRDYHISSCVLP